MQSFPGHIVKYRIQTETSSGADVYLKGLILKYLILWQLWLLKRDFFNLVSQAGYHRDCTKGQKVCVGSYSFQQIPFI